MPHYRRFKVGAVVTCEGGYGFGVLEEAGSPLLFITYSKEDEAEAAQQDIASILQGATVVSTPGA